MGPKTKDWLGGLISALSGGVVAGMATMAAAPKECNLHAGLGNLILAVVPVVALAVGNYLVRRPLPDTEVQGKRNKDDVCN